MSIGVNWKAIWKDVWKDVWRQAGGSHSATGSLQSDAAQVSGTASHLTLHASTGALEAGSATVAGAAVHTPLPVTHDAVGSLVAGSAEVSGAGQVGIVTVGGGGGGLWVPSAIKRPTIEDLQLIDDERIIALVMAATFELEEV